MKSVLLNLSLVLPIAVSLQAQGDGGLSGTISDPASAGVPSAKIQVTDDGTGAVRTAISDSTGHYTVSPLSPGVYRVRVEAPGFEDYQQTGITLRIDERLRLDATLRLGQQKDTVSVSGEAIAVDTADGVIRSVVDVKRMVDASAERTHPTPVDVARSRRSALSRGWIGYFISAFRAAVRRFKREQGE